MRNLTVAEYVSSHEERVKAGQWVALFCDGSVLDTSPLLETHGYALRHVDHRPTWTVTEVARIGQVLTWVADSSEAPIRCTSKVSFDRSFAFLQPQRMPRHPSIARAHPGKDLAIAWTFTSLPVDVFMSVKKQAHSLAYNRYFSDNDDVDDVDAEGAALVLGRIWAKWAEENGESSELIHLPVAPSVVAPPPVAPAAPRTSLSIPARLSWQT